VTSGLADSSVGLQIELLGPVEARVDGRAVALGGQRPRTLLAVLALMGGRVVTTDRLIDELWGEDPPARARDSLQMHVSRLRKALSEAGGDGGRLVNQADGYLLDVQPGECDVDRWQQALEQARRARVGGEPQAARERIDEALGVWRGQSLGGVSTNSLLAAERARLEEERLAAIIEGIELDLELGRHGELLGQLDALVIAHPFKERLVELQMLALYRCGRQADALAVFQAARRRFVDELGIEPAQPLRELHENVLTHSAELSSPVDKAAERTVEAQLRPPMPRAFSERKLPVPPNRTIGREHDVAVVGERLRAGSVRLLTLTGPGGVGKTRLAVEAARAVQADFADGAHFVPLAALHGPEGVPAAIVENLEIVVLSGESADQAAERFLAAKHVLLVLDNLEHLLEAAPYVARLLEACPALTVLATSRALLSLQAEERYALSPLALPELETPEDLQVLAGTDAIALFCERAQAHDPDFELSDGNAPAVAEICRRVDGLPLAIELAAARCGLLSPTEIAERLDTALGGLGAGARDAPARQQTLRATIDWSHDLLSDAEKQCFARFAVFAGGATVEAAETITGAGLDVLDRLVAKSLLARRQHALAPTRLGMLETIRAYATDRFAATTEHDAIEERHYLYYLALAQRHGADRALMGVGGKEHLARLDAEGDNLRAALRWAGDRPSTEHAIAMVAALGRYWLMRDRYSDAIHWTDQALGMPGTDTQPALRVRALCIKASCLQWVGRGTEQSAVMAEADAIARTLSDPVILSDARQTRAHCASFAGSSDVGERFADEALDLATGAEDDWAIALAAFAKATQAPTVAELRERVDRAAALLDEVGNVYRLADLLAGVAAYGALCLGSDHDAMEFVGRAVPLVRELDNHFIWMILQGNLGLAALLTGDTVVARDAFREELVLSRELVARPIASEGLSGLAAVAVACGDAERAATLVGAAASHRYGEVPSLVDARLDAEFFEPARKRRGAREWDAAVRDGGTLNFVDAIAYALREPRA
jgi:predicted ATPase/DNA-binding SARP family transcriptional activator